MKINSLGKMKYDISLYNLYQISDVCSTKMKTPFPLTCIFSYRKELPEVKITTYSVDLQLNTPIQISDVGLLNLQLKNTKKVTQG